MLDHEKCQSCNGTGDISLLAPCFICGGSGKVAVGRFKPATPPSDRLTRAADVLREAKEQVSQMHQNQTILTNGAVDMIREATIDRTLAILEGRE